MADNLDKDKPNDDIQQNSNNNENNENVIIKEDIDSNHNNQIRDEDEYQDIKTSDLVFLKLFYFFRMFEQLF